MLRVPHLPMKEFKRLLKITPMICVDVVIVNGKGEFLLEKRTYPPHTGSWHLPGGFVGYKERLADAAKRKARQETGLKVKVLKYVGYYDDPRLDPRGSLIIHSFLARPTGGSETSKVSRRGNPKRVSSGKLKKDGLEWFKKAPKGMGFKFQIKELKDAGLVK